MTDNDFEKMVLMLPECAFQTPPFAEIRRRLALRKRRRRLIQFAMASAAGVLLGFGFFFADNADGVPLKALPPEELRLAWDGAGELNILSEKITELKQSPWRVTIREQ